MPVIRTRRATLALAVAGGALVAAGLGRAADDAGVREFFRDSLSRPAPEPVAPRSAAAPTGFAALTPAVRSFGGAGAKPARFEVVRREAPVLPATTPRRTVCVRICDGYAFPLGNLASRDDLPAHRAGCAAACPGAPTALYTLAAGADDIARATSLSGQPYPALATAGLHRRRAVPGCACNGAGIPHTPILRDPTLRAGDVVARAFGASAVAEDAEGRRRLVDFRRPGALEAPVRREVDRLTGTTRRELAEASFRRELRVRHAAMAAARGEPRVRLASAGGFAVLAAPAGASVRVVVPSPYPVR